VRVGELVDCCVYDLGSLAADEAILLTLGDAIWSTPSQIPLSPSPPYSLYDLTSRAENFALTYNAMPILLPEDAFEFASCGICAFGTKRKRICGGADGSGRRRKRIRKRRAVEHGATDNGLYAHITEVA
jgi:hypothetical protein